MRQTREAGLTVGRAPTSKESVTAALHRPALLVALASQARRRTNHPALVDPSSGSSLSYGALWARVRSLADALRRRGVGPEDRIGLRFERSLDPWVAALAVLDTGAAYVPLDPTYPESRQRWMVRDAGCSAVLTRTPGPTEIGAPWWPIDRLDGDGLEDSDGLEGGEDLEAGNPLDGQGGPDELGLPVDSASVNPGVPSPRETARGALEQSAAIILYTSGSTGRPKAVVVPHRALAWYAHTARQHYGLQADDRLLQLASIGFDISVGEVFPTLLAGGTVVLTPPPPFEPLALLDLCREERISVLFPATALWHGLAQTLVEQPEHLPPHLRLVSFGGEAVNPRRLVDWRRAVGARVLLFNGYGPTETTVEATLHPLTAAMIAAEPDEALAIGRPVSGVTTHLVDPRLNPVAEGEAGELCLDSPGLARGYLDRAARTAERFVPEPSGRHGGRLYRTGDLVRRRADGGLEILGRIDRQTKIRGFRIEPGEIEAVLHQQPDVAEAAVVVASEAVVSGTVSIGPAADQTAANNQETDRWLAAFVVLAATTDERPEAPRADDAATGILGVGTGRSQRDPAKSLRRRLQQQLPRHLVPPQILVVEALPLTPHGKIDRHALARLAAQAQVGLPAAATAHGSPSADALNTPGASGLETSPTGSGAHDVGLLLSRLWRRVLRIDTLDPGADFFALGGDSILGIRLASQAQRYGLPVTSRDLFEHPTLASLTAQIERRVTGSKTGVLDAATNSSPLARLGANLAEPTPETPLPLTPVQRWFFDDAELDTPAHFNQSMLLGIEATVSTGMLRRAIPRLVQHHAALRFRFVRDASGRTWQHTVTREPRAVLLHLDLTALPPELRETTLEQAASQAQASLDLTSGPLLRAVLFEGRPSRGAEASASEPSCRLLLAIHHLVVDGVSWGILIQDLDRLLDPRLHRDPLPPVGTSYGRWALLQEAAATQGLLSDEVEIWQALRPDTASLPRDLDDRRGNTLVSQDLVARGLDRRRTADLLRRVPAAYRTRINDVLLTALALTLRSWSDAPLWLDLEGHGREPLFETDLGRTVGWFTSTFPVLLDLPEHTPLGLALCQVKETLRSLPHHGVGYGMLHYLAHPDQAEPLRDLPRREISFNYLGQLDTLLADAHHLSTAPGRRGRERGFKGRRAYVLELDGGIVDGQLWLNWGYSRHLHHRSTIEGLARGFIEVLAALVDHCLEPGQGALTPSDVPLAGLDLATLHGLIEQPRELEDLLPLAPLQRGMLFHSLLSPETSVYLEQSSWLLEGPLQVQHLRTAWQRLLDRHPILRTAFVWRGVDPPLQAVHRHRELPWIFEDWSALSEPRQQEQLETKLDEDRRRGLPLDQAPLTRVTLLRLADTRHRLVWTYHHALLDGWSISALFDEVFTTYEALCRGTAAPPTAAAPWRRYLAWLEPRCKAAQDTTEQFFRRQLAEIDRATPPPVADVPPTSTDHLPNRRRASTHHLPSLLGRALEAFARTTRVTPGTVLHAAWGLLLARVHRTEAVLFGVTFTDRPAEIPDADAIVGPMINSLPVCLRPVRGARRGDWLRLVQRQLAELRQFGHCSLADVRRWTQIPAGLPLFESLLVFENYPVTRAALEEPHRRGALEISDFRGRSDTEVPLTLAVVPGERWRLELTWDLQRLGVDDARPIVDQLESLLRDLIRSPEASLDALWLPAIKTEKSQTVESQMVASSQPDWSPSPASQPTTRRQHDTQQTGASDPGSLPRRVERLWLEALGLHEAPNGATFFELGGDSLLAMRLLARLRQDLGIELPLRQLFDYPTLGGLTAQVGQALRRQGSTSNQRLPQVEAQSRPPRPALTSGQRRLWILDQLEPGDPAYHVAGAWHLRGPLDLDALALAVTDLVDRHEALRTTFPSHRGEPYQAITPPPSLSSPNQTSTLPRIDLQALPSASRRTEAQRQADRLALRPFDLTTGPLLRLVVFHLDTTETLLAKSQHHIVSDATSEALFARELSVLYRAARKGHPALLPNLASQPVDAVAWNQVRVDTPHWAQRFEALCQRLRHLPPLELPRDHGGERPYRPGHTQHVLGPALTADLERWAAASGASLFLAITAATAVLFHRLGAGDTVVLGSPVANRPTPEHERWIGFFVETVVLRVELEPSAGFAEALAQVRDTALDAWSHQDVPFDRLVDALAPPRRPGRPPLVQAMVDWLDTPHPDLDLEGLESTWVDLAGSSGRTDLSVTGWRTGGSLHLDVEFDASRYAASTVGRWVRSLERLLTGALTHPERPLAHLDLLSPAERHQLTVEAQGWPQATVGLPWLDPRVATPASERLALVDGVDGRSMPYGVLDGRVRYWRRRLADLPRETVVAVLTQRDPECLAAMLGVLAAGCVFLPIDPEDPLARQHALITRSGARRVIGRRAWIERLQTDGAEPSQDSWQPMGPVPRESSLHARDDGLHLFATTPERNAPRRRPDAPAYEPPQPLQAAVMLHTSGSTGRPKAVVLTHEAVARYATDAASAYPIWPGDRVLQFAHWSFDLLLEEVFPTLLQGATLVLRTPEAATPEGFWRFCALQRITVASVPTAFWHQLVDSAAAAPDDPLQGLPATDQPLVLRSLIVGGEKVDPRRREVWRRLTASAGSPLRHTSLHDTYGPTETTVVCTRVPPLPPAAPDDSTWQVDGALGVPIRGTRVLVLDPQLEPCPLGVPGELAIAGPGLARGYHGSPATTAAVFVPDPLADGSPERPAGGRLYRTGDRGRWRATGGLQYLGRRDHQLKIRGFRVEPGDVEATLRQHTAVRDAVVAGHGSEPRLVAWIVPQDPATPPTVDALREHCARTLPSTLHPTVWVSTQELPLDRRGKVDRRRLPSPDHRRPHLEIPFRAPENPAEKTLAAIWRRVLDLEHLGTDDDFFALGGDSLLAIQATEGARRAGFLTQPMDVMAHPTVARLARALPAPALRGGRETLSASPSLGRPTAPRTSTQLALTPIQHWFFDWRLDRRWHFNQSFRLVARRPLEPRRLHLAAQALLASHDALRLRFTANLSKGADPDSTVPDNTPTGSQGRTSTTNWRQTLAADDPHQVVVLADLRHLEADHAEDAVETLCAAIQASLDLSAGPMLRLAILRLPGGVEHLLVVVHHLAVDGVSWPILLGDLEHAYGQANNGHRPSLPQGTPFQSWSSWLEERAQDPDLLREVPYWNRVLMDRPPLPIDRAPQRPGTDGPARRTLSRQLDEATTERVLRPGRQVNPRLLTPLVRTLGDWQGRSGLLVELESHGRKVPTTAPPIDVSRTVGWFTSTFPVWLELEGERLETQIEGLARQLDAVPHGGFHFGLLRYLSPADSALEVLRRLPGPEVNFNYLGRLDAPLRHSQLFRPDLHDPGPEQGHPGEPLHRFDLNGRVVGGVLILDWTYDPRYYRRTTVEALADTYLDELRRVADLGS